ncbi:autotransporter beta-domain protein [Anopheles sinensis]|uniref:Autotransporter beta-domain protein n=1 Tax=Anopheles sinensis TaxID=74873 RepID=A0A084W607_ANOSI|nr:autotransporter beta-domain protein [Anopheles sinensis]
MRSINGGARRGERLARFGHNQPIFAHNTAVCPPGFVCVAPLLTSPDPASSSIFTRSYNNLARSMLPPVVG